MKLLAALTIVFAMFWFGVKPLTKRNDTLHDNVIPYNHVVFYDDSISTDKWYNGFIENMHTFINALKDRNWVVVYDDDGSARSLIVSEIYRLNFERFSLLSNYYQNK